MRSTPWKWAAVLGAAALVLALPTPAGVTANAWRLLAIFAATMVGLVLQPIPGGAIVFLGVCAVAVTGLATMPQALAGYGDPVVWLVLAAFFISRAMIKTGLGRRIALHFIRVLGSTSLGLGYALGSTELLLGMVIPSTGARSGGIIFPIGKSLAEAYDSHPGETARRLGSFLMLMLYNSNVVVCAMFLTGQASNPLIAGFARQTANIDLTYITWMVGAIVPGMLAFLLVPLLIYRIHPPKIRHTPGARDFADRELATCGPLSKAERAMAIVFGAVLLLWLTKAFHPIDYVAVALLGVAALLLSGVLTWDDLLTERSAWDVFFWYGGLVQLAKLLSDSGIPKWFAGYTAGMMGDAPWWLALIALALIYFYAHYGFASITAHATAMYIPFVAVCLAAGAPPLFTVLILAYLSNLSASLTHYGTTPAPIYFGAGYTTQREWWRVGLLVSILNLIVWGIVGPTWWRILGWW
jgi:DASS family divalent anion:Na+ symporter